MFVCFVIFCEVCVSRMFTFPVVSSHQSGEVAMASFCRMESLACSLPSMLSALEEHDFLFQLQLNDMPPDDSSEVCVCKFSKVCLFECMCGSRYACLTVCV